MDANPEILKAIALELTIEMGELFRLAQDKNKNDFIVSDSAHIRAREDWRTKRLEFFADALDLREPRAGESITCDPKRTPAAIARDIRARLLPHARAHLQESRAYDLAKRKEENAERLRENLIKRYCPYEYQRGKFRSNQEHGTQNYFYAHTTYDDRVHIETDLHMQDALKLLKFLTQEIK